MAEALAQIRDPEWLVSIAAQVFVVQPPFKPPTGTYLGVVHFQRLLREMPSTELSKCLENEPTITPDLPEREVAERIASYNMLAVGVTDEAGHLLGAITVDDVLDRTLPTGWRQRRRVGAYNLALSGANGSGGVASDVQQVGTIAMTRRNDLATPRQPRRLSVHYDQDAFGQFSESIARTLGTARFLVWQTVVIVVWIGYNLVAPDASSSTRGDAVWCCSRSCCRCRRATPRR